jgi:hypothetical protein
MNMNILDPKLWVPYDGPQKQNGDFLENGSHDFGFESFKEFHLHFLCTPLCREA